MAIIRRPVEEHVLLKAFGDSGQAIDRVLVAISAVILAPIFEELLFRGHVQTAIRQLTGRPWVAVVITAMGFAAVAYGLVDDAAVVSAGAVSGYAYERTGSLWTPIIMHGMFNAVSVMMTYWAMPGEVRGIRVFASRLRHRRRGRFTSSDLTPVLSR